MSHSLPCHRRPGTLTASIALCLLLTLTSSDSARAQNSQLIVITEIMYNPAGTGREGEYIEIHNASPAPVDLSGWYFSRGIQFQFPDGFFMEDGDYVVVCADQELIRARYNIENTLGDWGTGNCDDNPGDLDDGSGCALANGGEAVELSEQNGVVHCRVRYDDRGKWPVSGDGLGHSIGLDDPYDEPDDPDNWETDGLLTHGENGTIIGGSPGEANDTTTGDIPVVLNEALLYTAGELFLELYNKGEAEVDLSGYWIVTGRNLNDETQRSALPANTVLASRARLRLTETQLGLDLTPIGEDGAGIGSGAQRLVSLVNPDRTRVIDGYSFRPEQSEKSEARLPDGDEDWIDRAEPTPGEPNAIAVESDIVINEIMYHPLHGEPSGDQSFAEYLELHNRSTDRTIDISGWKFTRGINFEFPAGTEMPANSYLVVARDPAYVTDVYGLPADMVFGPDPDEVDAFGRLRDDGERVNLRDADGKLADTVRYHDGGQWPLWADGGGSSMELIDAWHDNNVPSSWESSDDSSKASVTEIEYDGVYFNGEPELHFAANGMALTIVDDIRMVERIITFVPDATLVPVGASYKFFAGTEEPSDPVAAWHQPGFDDSRWDPVTTPIGYGEEDRFDNFSTIEGMEDNYLSFYLRTEFPLTQEQIDAVTGLRFHNVYDDGFAAYLNGTRIVIENLRPSGDDFETAFNSRARSSRERREYEADVSEFKDLLQVGPNVLAVQTHNSSISSSDVLAIPSLESGEFVPADSDNYVVNGDFEAELGRPGTRPGQWQIQGTHINTGRTTNPDEVLECGGSLKLIARSKGDYKVNRIEQQLGSPLRTRNSYNISMKARWIVGSETFQTHGDLQNFAKSHLLSVPRDLGTPGARNSATAARIAALGSANLGPTIDKLVQEPALPRNNQDVTITVRVRDPDTVQDVKLFWSTSRPADPDSEDLNEVPMAGPNVRNRYTATIPGQRSRTSVIFYIVATDANGRTERYPIDPAERVHPRVVDAESTDSLDRSYVIYRHENPQTGAHPSYRFWTDTASESYMSSRRLLSNDKIEGSFLFQNRDIYHHARARFSGSPWARGAWSSFRIQMPKDNPLHGRIKKFGLESHQRGDTSALERISNYLIRHNQGNTRAPFFYQWLVQWQANSRSSGVREHVHVPDRELLQRWFPGDSHGSFFEMDDRFEFSDAGSREDSTDGKLTYPPYTAGKWGTPDLPPEDKENYRYFFSLRSDEQKDDFSHLVRLAQVMDRRQTPNEVYDEIIHDHIDTDAFLRVLMIRMHTTDWDTWGTDRGKNAYIYRRPSDGQWVLLPWDMELTYEDGRISGWLPPADITRPYTNVGGKFPELQRLWNHAKVKRQMYGILWEMINHQFNGAFLRPYQLALQRRRLSNTQVLSANGFIQRRSTMIRNAVSRNVTARVDFELTTNGGDDFTAETNVVRLEGQAGVDISDILVTVDGDTHPGCDRASFSNSNPLGWYVDVPLAQGVNEISFIGVSTAGEVLGTTQISVTAALTSAPMIDSLDPAQTEAGEWVTIHGANLHLGVSVRLGDTVIAAADTDCTGAPARIAFRVPDDTADGEYAVVVSCPEIGESDSETLRITVPDSGDGTFIRGDPDLSGRLNVSDAVQILHHLFLEPQLICEDAADLDDDGQVILTDAIILLNFLFRQGIAPAAPFPEAGTDPTEDDLGCAGA